MLDQIYLILAGALMGYGIACLNIWRKQRADSTNLTIAQCSNDDELYNLTCGMEPNRVSHDDQIPILESSDDCGNIFAERRNRAREPQLVSSYIHDTDDEIVVQKSSDLLIRNSIGANDTYFTVRKHNANPLL